MITLLSALVMLAHAPVTAAHPFSPPAISLPVPAVDTPATDTLSRDSSSSMNDTIQFNFNNGGFHIGKRKHTYILTGISKARQVPYTENFSLLDFNRVTGFFLGLGTPGMVDLGPHDEIGLEGSGGYGFASKRWEDRFGGEFRLPLANVQRLKEDTSFKRTMRGVPTIAVGAEVHNITSTDDAWRADRLENALDAFFAREDFRDYYKLAGWDAYLALRPFRNTELRIDWRSDHYQSLDQTVFYGRFGGNKVLPPNPPVAEGEMHSLAISAQMEHVHTRIIQTTNLFGDSVSIEQLAGRSNLLQVELGHMPGSDFGFNRYLLDMRMFHPILHGLNLDTRLRFEATTGDMIEQKMEFLGGPGSLPALYRKSIEGNRMLLLNTEVRLNLAMLSAFFHSPDLNLVLYNDFAKMGIAGTGESIVQGFQFSGVSSILYNVGVGLGWTNGIQVGASWGTDIKADPRIIFRLQRSF
ncbi:MAG TPA: hypothetical protein VFH95_13235 [Candidatus Kapabacteria bacterium]|nr:hypothetical protein [Candidatus Kapabacteria bacterium]